MRSVRTFEIGADFMGVFCLIPRPWMPRNFMRGWRNLVDALDLGSSARKGVGVRVPLLVLQFCVSKLRWRNLVDALG